MIAGGVWGGQLTIQAMAFKLERHILIIDTRDSVVPILCPSSAGCYFEGQKQVHGEIGLPCQTKNPHRQLAIPDVAFDVDTLVVIYNGKSHYWCTKPSFNSAEDSRGTMFLLDDVKQHLASLSEKCQLPRLKLITPAA